MCNRSHKTLRKYFDRLQPPVGFSQPLIWPQCVVFDATFFWRGFGILLFRTRWQKCASRSKKNQRIWKNLCWKQIATETIESVSSGLDILDIICPDWYRWFTIDGRKWVRELLEKRYPWVPVQFCQFHQKQIIERYTTKKPKTLCGQDIRRLIESLSITDEYSFTVSFRVLQIVHRTFLLERNEKWNYMHKRLRSAFRSINTNLPYLFTYKKYSNLYIENTTNTCDGYFSHLKTKIWNHRGISLERKRKMIDDLLSRNT